MKNILLSALAVLFSMNAYSQNFIDKHYDDLQNMEDVTRVYVSGKMFSYASYIDVENDEELEKIKDLVSNVQSLHLIVAHDLTDPMAEFEKGYSILKNDYEELVQVRDKEGRFSLYIDEEDGVIYELAGIATGDNKFVVGSIKGEMDLETISEMISKINIDDNDNPVLERFKESGVSEFKAYPNPVTVGGSLNIELPVNMLGAQITIFDTNGAQVKKNKASSTEQIIQLEGLAPGQYVIQLDNASTLIKKKVVIIQ